MPIPAPLSDEEFFAAFLECTLAPASFDHMAHLRIAWLMLQRFPLDRAINHTCHGIARLAAQFGVPDKFHRTLSEALVRLIHARLDGRPDGTWDGFLQCNPDIRMDARGLLSRYYSARGLSGVIGIGARRHCRDQAMVISGSPAMNDCRLNSRPGNDCPSKQLLRRRDAAKLKQRNNDVGNR